MQDKRTSVYHPGIDGSSHRATVEAFIPRLDRTTHMPLPPLFINRTFMVDLHAGEPPCFALGLVETDGRRMAFMGLKPNREIPRDILAMGIRFGHCLLGVRDAVLCLFAFQFYGFASYSALVNPANPVVRSILQTSVEHGDYLFLYLGPGQVGTAFRSEPGELNFAGLGNNLPRMLSANTTDEEYELGCRVFMRNPDPDSELLTWICRDKTEYLDLERDTVEIPSK